MAFGLTPNYTQDLSLEGLPPTHFLALCVTRAHSLDWDIRHVSDAGFIALTTKKVFKRKQKIELRIANDIAGIRSESIGSEITDWGRNKRAVEYFIAWLDETRKNTSPEQLDEVYEGLKPALVPQEQDSLSQPLATAKEKWSGFFGLFVPRKGYLITPILVDLNIAIFILMVACGANFFLPDTHTIVKWGGNVRFLTLDGQWWRVITCCFLHYGIFHLLLNMYALLYIGVMLEPRLGARRFASAYLFTGITASLASLYWHDNVISAGASGAIFGMYGVFLALLTTNLIEKTTRKALLMSIGIFVAYNLLYGANGTIDNAAHIGGLLGGIVIGYLYYPSLIRPQKPTLLYSMIGVAAFLVVATSMLAFRKIPNHYGLWVRKMNTFASYEIQALAVTKNLNSDTPKEVWLHALRDSSIFYWSECLRTLNEADQLNVPEKLKVRSYELIRYCNLRIQGVNYFAKRISGATAPGEEDSTAIYNAQITEIVDGLNKAK